MVLLCLQTTRNEVWGKAEVVPRVNWLDIDVTRQPYCSTESAVCVLLAFVPWQPVAFITSSTACYAEQQQA